MTKIPLESSPAKSALLPSTRVLVRGIQGFLIFSLAGTLFGIWWKRPAGVEDFLLHLEWRLVFILVPLIGLDYLVGGLRHRLYFDGKVLPYVSLWNCMRANWAQMFMGAATPFNGGGPAQFYILWRCGAAVADAILIALINFTATLVFFLVASVAALLLLPPELFGENIAPLVKAGFIAVGSVAGLIILILLFPQPGMRLIKKIFALLPFRREKFLARRDRLLRKLEAETQRFEAGFQKIIREKKWALAVTVLATVSLFFNKYVMGYIIARMLRQDVPFGIFLGLQIFQFLVIQFAPTPGASGVAELSSVWLMEKLMPASLLLIYAVLWRFAATVLAAAIGGAVLLLDVRHWAQKTVSNPVNATPVSSEAQRAISG
jgi:uncharacterized protein (TIRG00374 family)